MVYEGNGNATNLERKQAESRWYRAEIAAFFLAFVAFTVAWTQPSSIHLDENANVIVTSVGLLLWFALVLIVSEALRRLCLYFEEKRHLDTRYDDKVSNLVKALSCDFSTYVFTSFSIFTFLLCLRVEPKLASEITLHKDLAFGLCGLYLLLFALMKVHQNSVEWSVVLEKQLVALGPGLAYAYHYGFLQIILPPNTTDKGLTKGFAERAQDFDEQSLQPSKHKLETNKLLIVVPDSCYCTSDFESMDPDGIERAGKIEDVIVSRAGMRGRPYSACVYRIQPSTSSEVLHVIMDMPALLLTLFEMNSVGERRMQLTPAERLNQVQTFVFVLKNLLDDDPGCRDQYEIIYYKDKDVDGKSAKLSEVIWNHFRGKTASQ